MSTLTLPSTAVAHHAERSHERARWSFPGIIWAECIKLLSLRSTWWFMALAVVLMTLFALGSAMSLDLTAATAESAGMLAVIHGAELISSGYPMGMIMIAVLGSLLITGEYSTGMIRSTFAAVPTRVPVLAAKAIVLVVLTVAVSAVSLAASSAVTFSVLSDLDLLPALTDAQTWQVFGGTTFFLVAAALFALGVGTLLRSTAGAVTVSLTVLLLLPGLLQLIRLDWVQSLIDHLPMPAATAFLATSGALGSNDTLEPWQGVLVVAGYAVVPLVAAALTLRRRDA
ncbi:ABC transporter permease subunit [Occultella aeris]|uniref:ABC-2 family transporter protein n=1 Tax=Occultella aeris TaxID=2761496 RepID=A0A7M4DJX0_9MICO|nr:ABC transporter permease subunit [Occultella aeris]VZO37357.1 ABC-2 family transporter protein [Occultella aeris]